MATVTTNRGAGFLLGRLDVEQQMTPEKLTAEQRMLRDTVRKFVDAEILPRMDELETLDIGLARELLQKTGELGLCMIDVPEEYEGLGLDFVSSIQGSEILSLGGGFLTAFSVQTGIGLMPMLYFGSDELKRKFLPGMASVELVSAYALTEAGSGSDALGAKTTADLSEDGESWVLNGTKQFITNGGFADVFTVFAQVDGRQFTAFLVERDTPGFTVGPEEHKLGIKSSSTTSLSFEDCRIPKGNIIGEVGQGGKIAVNVLNLGRLKLGISAIGSAKEALEVSVRYALERKQFGRAIAEFGMIREKIAEMASRIYAGESSMLRTSGNVQEAMHAGDEAGGASANSAMRTALREFNVECALEKVHGSEVQAYCVDEAIQIHGGYGFIEEYKVARTYRDARISRIYEGTNEINRMQIAGDVLKRAGKGALDMDAALSEAPGSEISDQFGALCDIAEQVDRTRAVARGIIKMIVEQSGGEGAKRGGDQELLQRLADIIIAIYALESAMGRAVQARRAGDTNADEFEAMTRVYAAGVAPGVRRNARETVALLTADGADEAAASEIAALAEPPAVNAIALRRVVAEAIIEREGRWFDC